MDSVTTPTARISPSTQSRRASSLADAGVELHHPDDLSILFDGTLHRMLAEYRQAQDLLRRVTAPSAQALSTQLAAIIAELEDELYRREDLD